VLCYYAYATGFYTGSPDQRKARLDPVSTCHASLPRTGTVTVTRRLATVSASALHLEDNKASDALPGPLEYADGADASDSQTIGNDENFRVESGSGSATYHANVAIDLASGVVTVHSGADVEATATVTSSGPTETGSAGASGSGNLAVLFQVTGSVRHRITGTATDCGSLRLHESLSTPSIELERGPYDLDLTGVLTAGTYEYTETCSKAAGINEGIGSATVSGTSDVTLTLTR
jgi:hypothetical protein